MASDRLPVVMGWLKKGVLDHIPPDVLAPFERLERLFASVKDHPKVVEWYARAR